MLRSLREVQQRETERQGTRCGWQRHFIACRSTKLIFIGLSSEPWDFSSSCLVCWINFLCFYLRLVRLGFSRCWKQQHGNVIWVGDCRKLFSFAHKNDSVKGKPTICRVMCHHCSRHCNVFVFPFVLLHLCFPWINGREHLILFAAERSGVRFKKIDHSLDSSSRKESRFSVIHLSSETPGPAASLWSVFCVQLGKCSFWSIDDSRLTMVVFWSRVACALRKE